MSLVAVAGTFLVGLAMPIVWARSEMKWLEDAQAHVQIFVFLAAAFWLLAFGAGFLVYNSSAEQVLLAELSGRKANRAIYLAYLCSGWAFGSFAYWCYRRARGTG